MLTRHELIGRCAQALGYEVEEKEDKVGKHWVLKNILFLDGFPTIYDPTEDFEQAYELIGTFMPDINWLPDGNVSIRLGKTYVSGSKLGLVLVECIAKSRRKSKQKRP